MKNVRFDESKNVMFDESQNNSHLYQLSRKQSENIIPRDKFSENLLPRVRLISNQKQEEFNKIPRRPIQDKNNYSLIKVKHSPFTHKIDTSLQQQIGKESDFTHSESFNELLQYINFDELSLVQVELVECLGCSRKFDIEVLNRHQAICREVSQGSRTVFNSKLKRVDPVYFTENVEYQPSIRAHIPRSQIRLVRKEKIIVKACTIDETPEIIYKGPTKNEHLKLCVGCGRMFSDNVFETHMPSCRKRAEAVQLTLLRGQKKYF